MKFIRITKRGDIIIIVLKIIIILFIGAFLSYKEASPISRFLFYSFIFYRFIVSKNIIFWSAFLFIILNNPWGLFYFRPANWMFPITQTVGFSYTYFFGFAFLIKSGFHFKKRGFTIKDYFHSFYKPIVFFVIFLLFWSFIYGHNAISIYNILRFIPAFFIFYCVPVWFNKNELVYFNRIIFIFSIFHLIGSFIEIIKPGTLMKLLFFGNPATGIAFGEDDLIRIVGGITIHLYVMVISLFYLCNKENKFKKWYLWLLIILSWLFILNSATRGWMIASSFLLLGYFIYRLLKSKLSIKSFATVIVIFFCILIFIPNSVKRNMKVAFNRLETLEAVAEGDLTAEGTLYRLTERGPLVLTRFSDSPIVGFGYSKVSAEYYDPHVGNHNLLLVGGIIGLAIFWLTMLFMVSYFFRMDFKFPTFGFFVFGLALLSIMIIHSTSRTMVSFYMPVDAAFLIALIFNNFNSTLQFNYFKKLITFEKKFDDDSIK